VCRIQTAKYFRVHRGHDTRLERFVETLSGFERTRDARYEFGVVL
jgi:hypothetical protein